MVSVVGMNASMHKMKHEKDPKKRVLDSVGDISGLELWGVQVLVGTYLRPETTEGGIILTAKTLDEDKHQGKVGLVLKVADQAFSESADVKFGKNVPKVGDWVFYYIQDGRSISVNGYHCRVLEDTMVRGRVHNPDIVL